MILFARTDAHGNETTELRVIISKSTMQVIDLVAHLESLENDSGKDISRSEIINRILNRFAREQFNKAILFHKIIDTNPTILEELERRKE